MSIHTGKRVGRNVFWAACAAGLLLTMTLAGCKSAPNLTGKWASAGKTMANGEQQKTIFDLKQDGTQLTGQVSALGWQNDAKGTVNGTHFELSFADSNDKKPAITGDLVNGNLEGKLWDDQF